MGMWVAWAAAAWVVVAWVVVVARAVAQAPSLRWRCRGHRIHPMRSQLPRERRVLW